MALLCPAGARCLAQPPTNASHPSLHKYEKSAHDKTPVQIEKSLNRKKNFENKLLKKRA